MDIRKIKKLIEMLQESDLNEIEVTQGEESVKISRGGSFARADSVVSQAPISTPQISVQNEEIVEEKKIEGNVVTSPIVGTFYRKPAPDKDPFIKVGDSVEAGDVLCIIEAMKMMNEIKSDYSGVIQSIEVEDGQPVEFGQSIIIIK
jgi:acetyl-CoA carboxylase biotin carboxyl carrier protein